MLKVATIAGVLALTGLVASASLTPAWAVGLRPAADCVSSPGRIESGKRLCVTAPDDRKRVIVVRNRVAVEFDHTDDLLQTRYGADRGYVEWSPASDGFVIADEDGMGLIYFDLREGDARRSRRAIAAAIEHFTKTFNCVGPKAQAYALYSGWEGERIRLVVQESAKSEGCPARDPGNAMIGVLIDPRTNQIETVSQARVFGEWCAPSERRPYSQCHIRPRHR